jgi:hypothetical protein
MDGVVSASPGRKRHLRPELQENEIPVLSHTDGARKMFKDTLAEASSWEV